MIFIDTIVYDSANVWDLKVRVECMIGYVPGRVGYGSEKFRLVSLRDKPVNKSISFPEQYK